MAELNAALSAATGGEIIVVADGTYGDLELTDKTYASSVTVRAEAWRGAVFGKIALYNVSGLAIDQVTVDHPMRQDDASWSYMVNIRDSSYISFSNSEVRGSVDGIVDNDVLALQAIRSSHVTIAGNVIHDAGLGIALSDSQDVRVADNDIFVPGDGLHAVNMDGLLIEKNAFHDPHPFGGFHPDFIQFHCDGGALGASRNVTIRDNLMYEGSGEPSQAIFLTGREGSGFVFRNFLIENNLIVSTINHGISFDQFADADGIVIRNNSVISVPFTGDVNAIRVKEGALNVTIANNVVTSMTPPTGATLTGNTIIQSTNPNAANYYGDLFVNPFGAALPGNYLPVPGSAIDLASGKGAAALAATLARPPVWIAASAGAGIGALSMTFTTAPYPGGHALGGGATYQWNFGDGTTGSGASVTHAYAAQGTYDAVLTVTDGAYSATVARTVRPLDPLLVDMTFDGSVVNTGGSGGVAEWVGTPAYVAGVGGQAADFDGTGHNYTRIKGASNVLSGMKQLTISFDFRADGSPSIACPLWLHTGYGIFFDRNNVIRFELATESANSNPVLSAASLTAFNGSWHRLVATYDGITGAATLYLDGNAIATKSGLSGRVASVVNRDLTIGSDSWGTAFDGQIDNLRIYSGIVPPDQEATIYAALTS